MIVTLKPPFFCWGWIWNINRKASVRRNKTRLPTIAVPIRTTYVRRVVDRDVALNPDSAYPRRNPNKLPVQRIYYADDTVLISTNTAAANRLLAEVEGVSKQFGLHLNRNKCCYISMNDNNVIKFPDGQKLNRVEETTYLGHHKMHQTLKTWFKLDTFWKTTVCSNRWKLQVYDAIIKNKPLYWLETVHLTQTQQKKVNAFQLRGLRKILGLSTTFVNRSKTNEYVLQKANEEIGHTPGTPSKIKLFSELLKDRRVKLAGHILRSNNSDALRRVSYEMLWT